MPENTQSRRSPSGQILAGAEARRRAALLTKLQSELAAHGVTSTLARNHRLVLRAGSRPCEPSGPTDPQLHIFAPNGTKVVVVDGGVYRFASGQTHRVDDPAGVASRLCRDNGHQALVGQGIRSSSS